ncbi:MAG: hypothetical protein GX225_01345 [Clostridiales bacterium]|nr:hypothetical protein [Clostridiales bacterium]
MSKDTKKSDVDDFSDTETKKERNKRIRRTVGKSLFLTIELFVVLVLSFSIILLVTPNAKSKLMSSWLGKFLVKFVISHDDYGNILDSNFDRDNMNANEGVDLDTLDGYTNIALFGLDSRYGELEQGVRSDTIIIVSINKETKEIKMCSVYRDNWVRVLHPDGSAAYSKINSAYAYGGPSAAVKTLNTNFDLNIKDYASVNFYGLATIIDMLGGIDVKITSTEKYWINQYLTETRKVTGMYSPDVASYGYVHLDGLQATAYCRIRKTTFFDEDGKAINDDFGRTARQRFVITQLVSKAKSAGVSKIMELTEEIFHGDEEIIKTSIPYDDLLDLIPVMMDFSIAGNQGFPTTYDCPDKSYTNGDSAVVAQGFTYNVKKMHQFLFGDYGYTPSEVVQGISESIMSITHVEERTLPEDAISNKTKNDAEEED